MWWGLGWTRQKCRLRQVEAEVIIGTNTSCCYEEKSEVYTQRTASNMKSEGLVYGHKWEVGQGIGSQRDQKCFHAAECSHETNIWHSRLCTLSEQPCILHEHGTRVLGELAGSEYWIMSISSDRSLLSYRTGEAAHLGFLDG